MGLLLSALLFPTACCFLAPVLFWQRQVLLFEEHLPVPLHIEDECHLANTTIVHKLGKPFGLAVEREVLSYCRSYIGTACEVWHERKSAPCGQRFHRAIDAILAAKIALLGFQYTKTEGILPRVQDGDSLGMFDLAAYWHFVPAFALAQGYQTPEEHSQPYALWGDIRYACDAIAVDCV